MTQCVQRLVRAELALGPVDAEAWRRELRQRVAGPGALVFFEGLVRPETKGGERLDRLVLEHHPRLTVPSLAAIAEEGRARFAVSAVSVVHRAGAMEPGDLIVLVGIASDHRREAFLAADYLMDRLKTDAVFWKREEGPFGERWIEPTTRDAQDRERWNEDNPRN